MPRVVREKSSTGIYHQIIYVRLNDTEASNFIRSISGVQSQTEVALFEKGKRNEIIKTCKEKGLSFRQIREANRR